LDDMRSSSPGGTMLGEYHFVLGSYYSRNAKKAKQR
jgi:hypothetical protein